MKVQTEPAWISPMGRVLDMETITGMGVGEGSFTAQLSDPLCPWNEGVWQFESANGVLAVSKGGSAECELNINALSALFYGTHDPGDFALRDWGNPTQELRSTMRRMFPAKLPYLHEIY